ncbi:primosomal replication protein [Thalassotalea ponticola]|uniref:primosomal replication protein PriC n=1 Tax=Thalassotalea ponticola TaxID=1523392 RepID=UPI0025B31377|nr:primosomal replication protein PriC [Thalassotalea ponticola]MDN3653183.1 primosomal replication protein [Thalassotalea ponticola]
MKHSDQQAWQKLSSIISELEQQATAVDQANEKRKQHYYLQESPLFSETTFPISSNRLRPYVVYVQKQLKHVQHLLSNNQQQLADALLIQIEQQVSAIIVAIKSDQNRHRDSDYRLQRNKRRNQQQQAEDSNKQLAKRVMLSAHQLHTKLVEYRGFESRLELMIKDHEKKLARAQGNDKTTEQQKIFALHQRLGRCRRAINDVERQIEESDKRSVR